MSVCLGCGAECEGNYCSNCGRKRSEVIKRIRELPEDLRVLVERLSEVVRSNFEDSASGVSERSGPMIMATGDVVLTGSAADLENAKIYSTGSVMFAPSTEKYTLDLKYNGKVIRTVVFYSTVVFRREWSDDRKEIAIYTDYSTYDIDAPLLAESSMRTLSRKPVAILRYRDKFYIYSENRSEGYLSMDGHTWPNSEIKEIGLMDEVRVGSMASIVIH